MRRGFTLVELLVVISIVGMLTSVTLPAIYSSVSAARQVQCANNMRQIGIEMVIYCDRNDGRFPRSTHTGREESWLFTLNPHLDVVRICPSDPQGPERLKKGFTSYVLNSYIVIEVPGAILNRNRVPFLTRTVMMFEETAKAQLSVYQDHAHSYLWFKPANIRKGSVYASVAREVDLQRHHGGTHFLYADCHVQWIPSGTIYSWCLEGVNFVMPPDDNGSFLTP